MEYVCRVGTPSGEASSAPSRRPTRGRSARTWSSRVSTLFDAPRAVALHVPLPEAPRGSVAAARLRPGSRPAAQGRLPLFPVPGRHARAQRDPLLRQSLAAVREKVKSGMALSDVFPSGGELYPPDLRGASWRRAVRVPRPGPAPLRRHSVSTRRSRRRRSRLGVPDRPLTMMVARLRARRLGESPVGALRGLRGQLPLAPA